MGNAWLDSIDIPAARFTGLDAGNPTTPARAPMKGTSGAMNNPEVVTGNVSLSADAKPFVPSIEVEAPASDVKTEPPTPTNKLDSAIANVNVLTPPKTLTPPPAIKIHEFPAVKVQLKSDRDASEDVFGQTATPSPDKAKENVKPTPIDGGVDKSTAKTLERLEKLDVDDEAHLPPHMRRKYRPKTPVQQTETTPAGTQSDEKSTSAVTKTPRKTPPHLRGLKTRG